MFRRIATAGIIVFSTMLALTQPAMGAAPERVESIVFDPDIEVVDPFLSEVCGFTVTSRIAGHLRVTEFWNQDGSFNRATGHPSFRSTLTSPTATITTADVGLDRFVENGDGTLSIFGTGIHLKLKGDLKAIGLWRLVIDLESGEPISQEYHGSFDVTAMETATALCEALS